MLLCPLLEVIGATERAEKRDLFVRIVEVGAEFFITLGIPYLAHRILENISETVLAQDRALVRHQYIAAGYYLAAHDDVGFEPADTLLDRRVLCRFGVAQESIEPVLLRLLNDLF